MSGSFQCFGIVFSNDMVEERHINIPPDILRGMLAEAGLERSYEKAAALQPLPLQQIYNRDWYAVTGRHVSVDEMGAFLNAALDAGTSVVRICSLNAFSDERTGTFLMTTPSLT